MDRTSATLDCFYRTERAGAARLADGGGPFGFDITLALLVDDIIEWCGVDALIETGCHRGDTTSYLARRYPELPVYSCDNDPGNAAFTRRRLAQQPNATVLHADSPELVAAASAQFERPLFYLDAHWGPDWPLARELSAASAGVVLIHDFDIGHPRFAFDVYDGVVCGPQILADLLDPPRVYFTPDPDASHPLPCLQTGRRAGVAVLPIGINEQQLCGVPHLKARTVPAPSPATAVDRGAAQPAAAGQP